MRGDLAVVVAISQAEALLQQRFDRQREWGGSRGGDLHHLATTPDRVLQAALMKRLRKTIETTRSVMHQKTGIVLSKNRRRLGITAMRFNPINGHLPAQQNPQILRACSHSPARVVQPRHGALPQPAAQLLVGGRRQIPQLRQGPAHPAAAPLQPIAQCQHSRRPLVRQSQFFVEHRRHRQGFWSYLYLAYAERIRGLQRMPALGLPSTAGTSPHLDVKAADDGHPHDILLVLRLGVLQDDRAVTVWATRGEWHVDLLIHPAGNRSCRSRSVCRTRLASRRLGVGLGFSLGKRRGTSPVGPQRFFQLLSQAFDFRQRALQLSLQRLHSPFEFLLSIRGATAIGRLHPFDDDINAEICPAPCLNTLCLLSCPLVNIVHDVLRFEAATNNVSQDYNINKGVENLDALRKKMQGITNRYQDVQRDILETFLDRGELRKLAEPTVLPNGKRIPGLKLDHPRQLAVMNSLLRFSHVAAGDTFTTAELRAGVAEALGIAADACALGSLRYELWKLRAKGLLEKLPRSRRYRLLPNGYRICLVFLKLFDKVYAPLTAGLLHPYRGHKAIAKDRLQQLDKLYQSVTAALDQLVAAVGLKVAA